MAKPPGGLVGAWHPARSARELTRVPRGWGGAAGPRSPGGRVGPLGPAPGPFGPGAPGAGASAPAPAVGGCPRWYVPPYTRVHPSRGGGEPAGEECRRQSRLHSRGGSLLGECSIPGGWPQPYSGPRGGAPPRGAGCSLTEGPKGHRRGVQEPSGQWQAVEGDPVGSSSKSLLHWGTAAGCRLGGSLLGECGIPGGCL